MEPWEDIQRTANAMSPYAGQDVQRSGPETLHTRTSGLSVDINVEVHARGDAGVRFGRACRDGAEQQDRQDRDAGHVDWFLRLLES